MDPYPDYYMIKRPDLQAVHTFRPLILSLGNRNFVKNRKLRLPYRILPVWQPQSAAKANLILL
ncbi:hypothetical protein CBFG_03679 [Clostridiales bacterium 1_7_47FAA]|nr:hypothetical protein CBFG_03679 [Clostridiales bacterium 1_7_47FAA]